MIRVFTDGVFDCLHANHVRFLRDARGFGNYLVVGVLADAVVESYKRRPVMTGAERLEVVSALEMVDECFLVDFESRPAGFDDEFLTRHQIDRVVYAGTATPDWYVTAEARGIMQRIPYREGISTSEVIARIRRRDGEDR